MSQWSCTGAPPRDRIRFVGRASPATGGAAAETLRNGTTMHVMPSSRFGFAAAAAAAMLSLGAHAADFYVAMTGNDADDGSSATPFATIGAAIDAADAAIANGDTDTTIHVAAGTYAGSGYVLTNAITVAGAGAASTVVNGNGGYRVFSLGSPAAVLRNLCVSNAAFTASAQQGAGVYLEAGLVEDCAIASCGLPSKALYILQP